MLWFNAARCGNVDELLKKLNAGQAVNEADSKGRTALLLAVEKGQIDAVRLLLNHGADTQIHVPRTGRPLTVAIRNKHWDIATMLIEAGADPNAGGVAYYVILEGQLDLLRLMLTHGLDPNGKKYRNNRYITDAIDKAYRKDRYENDKWIGYGRQLPADSRFLNLLLEHGADIRLAEGCFRSSIAVITRR